MVKKKKPKKKRVKVRKGKVKKVKLKKKKTGIKKAKKMVTKRAVSKKKKVVEKPMFEEITYNCPGCGRPMKVVKVSGYDVSGTLCQRCAQGDIVVEEETGE